MPTQMVPTTTLNISLDGLSPAAIARLKTAVMTVLEDERGASEPVLGWTPRAWATLLERLVTDGRSIQARILEAAAANGGRCDRDTVYELAGYPASRSLKGFTRPVNRVVAQLQREGVLPHDAADPMKPIYNTEVASFQQAQGFSMPPELADLVAP